jgi:hypothetical protein
VIDGIDPLGILHPRVVAVSNNSKDGGAGEGTALFAALYVRAPYDIVQMMHDIQAAATTTTQSVYFDDHIAINYLVYVLYVVPSEEESRLMHTPPAIRTTLRPSSSSYRTRAWSMNEYEDILHLLLRSISSSSLTSSHLLSCYQRTTCCGVVSNNITTGDRDRISSSLTPLAIACYNHAVPPSIVFALCTLQPSAMYAECTFFTITNVNDNNEEKLLLVKTLPLFLAAASPLPTNKQSSKYKEMHEQRWKKVQLLTLGIDWYNNNNSNWQSKDGDVAAQVDLTLDQVKHACLIAIQYNEWELVREYMKYYPAVSTEMVVLNNNNNNNNVSTTTTTIANALEHHDKYYTETIQHHNQKQEKRQKRREWLHRNMGPIMYEIDAIMDAVKAVIPTRRKKSRGGKTGCGIVLPMS